MRCSCCLIRFAYSFSPIRSSPCISNIGRHTYALDSYPKQIHSSQCVRFVCLWLERKLNTPATQTNQIKTETATTVSKRTLCWSRHTEIREQYIFFFCVSSAVFRKLVSLGYKREKNKLFKWVDNFPIPVHDLKRIVPVQMVHFGKGINLENT